MISEIDIRDWVKSVATAKQAYEQLRGDPQAAGHSIRHIGEFIDKVAAQVYRDEKQVAALLRSASVSVRGLYDEAL
jgi:hypothetical protein